MLNTQPNLEEVWVSFLNPAASLVCCALPVSLALRLIHVSHSEGGKTASASCSAFSAASTYFTFPLF